MASVTLRDRTGADTGSVELDDEIFGIEPNVAVMHQVVVAQLAAKRSGTQSTKTRSEVSGGGAKPWKPEGHRPRPRRARSAPRSGAVAVWRSAPSPARYAQKTPKKMKRLALRSALSDRAAEDKVHRGRRAGASTPPAPRTPQLRSRPSVSRARSLVVVDPTDADRPAQLPQPARRARDHPR